MSRVLTVHCNFFFKEGLSQCGGGVVANPHSLWFACQEVQNPFTEGGVQTQGSELGVQTQGSELGVQTQGSELGVQTQGSELGVQTQGSELGVEVGGNNGVEC